jgi:ketosteroid isomerase-like protein
MLQTQNVAFFTEQARTYLRELERGDAAGVCALFSPDAQVYSPFLGWMHPAAFFEKVIDASGQSTITPIDFCASTEGQARLTAYFIYNWVLKDGSEVKFECVDVFEFAANGLIEKMIIIYDTHPIRSTVGDKYA